MIADIMITAIVPVYNVEEYLPQCLASIIGQSVPFDEVIMVNDGSTDASQTICENYVSKYSYFKLINQRNRGLSAARNVGMDQAVSEYVMFVDSDDYLRQNTVRKLKEELSKFNYDAVYFNADIQCEGEFVVERNIYERNIEGLYGTPMSGQQFFLNCYPNNYIASACMAVYKKSTIKNMNLQFPEGLYFEDNYFTFLFMNQANYVTCIPDKLYVRRYRKNSITTSSYSEKKFIDHIKIFLLIWKEISRIKVQSSFNQSNMYFKYINYYCKSVLNNYCLYKKQNVAFGTDAEALLLHMIEKYVLLLQNYYLDDNIDNLALLNLIVNNLGKIINWHPEIKKNVDTIVKDVKEKQKQFYGVLLYDLPLNKASYKVGIYGIGKHTEGLLAIYENLIGKVTCNLVFLDSYKGNRMYMNREVIQYQQVDKSFNMIIISSFLYRNEMRENIRKINKEIMIYDFYERLKEDIFSDVDF